MPLCRLLLLTLSLTLLTACGHDSPLIGKWVFDRAKTEANLPVPAKPAPGEGESDLSSMKEGLAQMLIPQLIGKIEGATIEITSKEIIATTKEGSGQAEAYQVIDQPDPQTWRTKDPKGKITTLKIEGDHLIMPSTGDVHFGVYFKRL